MLKSSAEYELGWSREGLLRRFDPFQQSLYPDKFFNIARVFGFVHFWKFYPIQSPEFVPRKFYLSKLKFCIQKKLTIFNLINSCLILTFMYTQSRFSFIQYLYITGFIIWFDANQTPTDYDPPNLGYNIILIFCYFRLVFRKWK